MPPARSEKKQYSRQDPVSCQLCREKKLKCNREQPCSNCVARGVECHQLGQRSGSQPRSIPSVDMSIMARLKRLEETVLGLHGIESVDTSSKGRSVSRPILFGDDIPHEERNYKEDYTKLGYTGSHGEAMRYNNKAELSVRVADSSSTHYEFFESQIPISKSFITVWLPQKDEAHRLLERYAEELEYVQHLIYVPHVRAHIDNVFSNIQQKERVEPSHLALILSIFASTTFNCDSHDRGDSVKEESRRQTNYWIEAATEVLEYSRRISSGSLEDLQASAILSFLMYQTEGLSSRSRLSLTAGLTIGRELSMHRLDAEANNKKAQKSREEIIEDEIKRRVWWYMVASEWSLAMNTSPLEGTYTTNPRQMRVNKPRNINDEDLARESADFTRPLSEPTAASYVIQRIRFAEICRSVVDTFPIAVPSEKFDYQDIIALDHKFEIFFNELPVFFRLDEESRQKSQDVARRYPHIAIQRYTLAFTVPAGRCRLHQPFLVRGSTDGPYKFSRAACLGSARTVISAKRFLDQENLPIALGNASALVIHHVFFAIVVLAMDFCYNRIEGEDEKRREELVDVCGILRDAATQYPTAKRLLGALSDIFKKHNVALGGLDHNFGSEAENETSMDLSESTDSDLEYRHGPGNTNSIESDFDEIWKNYMEADATFHLPEWTGIDFGLDLEYF